MYLSSASVFPSVDFKFITCLINSCRILFSYFGEGKEKEKRFRGETLQIEVNQVRAPAYEQALLLPFKRYEMWSSLCTVSSSQR